MSLIGSGTYSEIIERHYAESLAALPLIPRAPSLIADIGSGAGFPGFVLAAALPESRAYLIEARQKKWAFLKAAARSSGVSVECLHARLRLPLPGSLPAKVDLLTTRAVQLPSSVWSAMAERLTEGGRVLVWAGQFAPELPHRLRLVERREIPQSTHRAILAYEKECLAGESAP